MKNINNYILEKLQISKDKKFQWDYEPKVHVSQSKLLFDCVKKLLDERNVKYDEIKLNAKKRVVIMFDTYRYQEIRKLAEEILPEIKKNFKLKHNQTIEYDCGYSAPDKTRLAFRFADERY